MKKSAILAPGAFKRAESTEPNNASVSAGGVTAVKEGDQLITRQFSACPEVIIFPET